VTHLVLTPSDGHIFNWTTAFIKPLLKEKGETGEYGVGEVRRGTAVFEKDGSGLGMLGVIFEVQGCRRRSRSWLRTMPEEARR
jgi:hypothetical protein